MCVVSACKYASTGETVRGPSGNVELGHHTVSTAQSKVHFRWICPITEIALFWGRTRSIVPWRSLNSAHSLPSSQKRAVTQRKYLSSGWQAVNEGQKQEKLRKTALPGAMVTEGQWPRLTHWAQSHGPHVFLEIWAVSVSRSHRKITVIGAFLVCCKRGAQSWWSCGLVELIKLF